MVRLKEGKFELPLPEDFHLNLALIISTLSSNSDHLHPNHCQYFIHTLSEIFKHVENLENFEGKLLNYVIHLLILVEIYIYIFSKVLQVILINVVRVSFFQTVMDLRYFYAHLYLDCIP